MQAVVKNMTLKAVLSRITEIDMDLSSRTYSQSDPGAMMDRRMLRKEKEKLEQHLSNLLLLSNPSNK
jgi:hypothetical protein